MSFKEYLTLLGLEKAPTKEELKKQNEEQIRKSLENLKRIKEKDKKNRKKKD